MSDKMSTRVAYGEALEEFGANPSIYVLDSDLKCCTMTKFFAEKYPERFFNIGIAEANMANMAAGIATCGGIALCHSFAMFAAGRIYDQVRNSIAYPGLNVKICGSHAGLTVGEDGPTHQCIEDLSLMRTIPGMVVLAPCDANETRLAVKAILEYEGPCYIRTGRFEVKCVTDTIEGYDFRIGKGVQLRGGSDVTIIACGIMVQIALKAAEQLAAKGINARLIDMHTIKPIDKEIICRAADETGAIVTAEEHNVIGGLGSAVAEVLSSNTMVPLERVGVEDIFGHSGKPDELLEMFNLTPGSIIEHVNKAINRKYRSV